MKFPTACSVFVLLAALMAGNVQAQQSSETSKPGKADQEFAKTYPIIEGYGAVVRLPDAVMQPRPGTRVLVDVTRGNDPQEVNDAIVKVAKYVNLYAGGGAKPASVQIAVVFHGNSTLDVLKHDAYKAKFGTQKNPNLALLEQLHEAGVEFYVCGQSLLSKGGKPKQVAPVVKTAVSAMSAVVNLQSEGYAYLPLGK
jgi:hypothetical protein